MTSKKRNSLCESEVKEILLKNKLCWVEGLSEYKRQNTPIICRDENGYTVRARISDINRGLNVRPFDIRNEYTLNNISIFVKNKNENLSVISDKYLGTDALLILKCNIDGNIINTTWHNIQGNNLTCEVCIENEKITKNTVSSEYLKSCVLPNYIKIYTEKDQLLEDFIDCYCEKHNHYFKMKCKTIIDGKGCPKCRNSTLELEDVIMRVQSKSPNVQILSTEYINAKTKLKCKCLIDNYEWEALPSSLLQGYGCPECGRINSEGYYCVYRAEKMKDKWTNQKSNVYILKLYDELETFYKVGITKNSIKKRFSSKIALPYSYDIISLTEMSLYDAVYFETEIKNRNKDFRYTPIKSFHGRSECFTKIIDLT